MTFVTDCDSVSGASGLYLISPDGNAPIMVYCEIQTKPTKIAYTVIQRRINGDKDFNKNWEEYAKGFGDLNGEFCFSKRYIFQLLDDFRPYSKAQYTSEWLGLVI